MSESFLKQNEQIVEFIKASVREARWIAIKKDEDLVSKGSTPHLFDIESGGGMLYTSHARPHGFAWFKARCNFNPIFSWYSLKVELDPVVKFIVRGQIGGVVDNKYKHCEACDVETETSEFSTFKEACDFIEANRMNWNC